jgi:hypothetical protein
MFDQLVRELELDRECFSSVEGKKTVLRPFPPVLASSWGDLSAKTASNREKLSSLASAAMTASASGMELDDVIGSDVSDVASVVSLTLAWVVVSRLMSTPNKEKVELEMSEVAVVDNGVDSEIVAVSDGFRGMKIGIVILAIGTPVVVDAIGVGVVTLPLGSVVPVEVSSL